MVRPKSGPNLRGAAARLGLTRANARKLRPRLKKRTIGLLALLGVIALATAFWATLRQTALLRETLETQLTESFGARVSIVSVQWNGWNAIRAEGLVLRVPDWPDPANQVVTIRSADVTFDPVSLLGGTLILNDMEMDGLTISIVEDASSPGRYNVFSLAPKAGRGAAVKQPQKALMSDLRLEFGELRDGQVQWTASRAFSGVFEHVPDDPSLYSFEISETEESRAGASAPIRVFGTWDERSFTYEVTLDSLRIDPRTIEILPLQARVWATASALEGRIESARLRGTPASPISFAEVDVRDVSIRERDKVRLVPWGRLIGSDVTPIRGDLTVRLPKATLTVRGGAIEVDAVDARILPGAPGSGAVDIPVQLRLSCDFGAVRARPFNADAAEAWLSDAFSTAPFELRVRLAGVNSLPGADGQPRPVELPLAMIDVLQEFGARDWLADVDITATRGATVPGGAEGEPSPASLQVRGRLALSDGTIRYGAFPYQLDHVTGVIDFDSTSATITDLAGRGSGNAVLRIGGDVSLVPTAPGFNLRVMGTDVPVDDRMLNGLDPLTKEILGTLLDRKAFASLRAANLSDETWAPGGVVGFDLRVRRPGASATETSVSGDITVHSAQVVIDSFPYPLRVQGSVSLTDDAVVLAGEGFTAVTPSGAAGRISGRIATPVVEGERAVRTDLRFDFRDERFSSLLLAAIPVSFVGGTPPPEGWPGTVRAPIAQLLTALGATGSLDIDGTVKSSDSGEPRVHTNVRIREGAVAPTPQLPRVLRRFGLSWPAQMGLTGVDGVLRISPDGLDVERLTARREAGTATARGHFSSDGEQGSLDVDLEGFPLVRDMIGIAEGAELATAYHAWDSLQPEGSFDGRVEWRHDGDLVSTSAKATLRTLLVAGTQRLDPVCGEFEYVDGEVLVRDLDLRGIGTTGQELRVVAGGRIIGSAPDFHASATGFTLASPVVEAGLRAGGQERILESIGAWRLDGGFDAELQVGGPTGDAPAWSLRVEPRWIAGTTEGAQFSALVQGGRVRAEPGGVRFEGLQAGIMHGRISLDGTITPRPDGGSEGDLTLGIRLAQWSPDLEMLLPAAARGALRGIEFGATAPVTASGLSITYSAAAGAPVEVGVGGVLQIARGTFRAGTQFTEADGTLDFHLQTRGGRPEGEIDLDFGRLFVVGREASDVHATLCFDSAANAVTLEDLEGWMYGGRVAGSARASFDGPYHATIAFANVKFAPFAEATDTPEQREAARAARAGVEDGPGRMRGRVDLSGHLGQPEMQRGTGRVQVVDARMIEFPLGLGILQLSQLMLPLNAALDRADVEFEIVGDVLSFEKFVLASSTLRLEGSGSLSLADGDLALRFRNRGTLPIVSDLIGAVLGDQVFMIDVGGTLQEPKLRLVPIPILAPEPSLPVFTGAKEPVAPPPSAETTGTPSSGST